MRLSITPWNLQTFSQQDYGDKYNTYQGRDRISVNPSLMNKLIRIEWVSECHKTASDISWHDYIIHEPGLDLRKKTLGPAGS